MKNKTINVEGLNQVDIEIEVTLTLNELYERNNDLVERTLPICMKLIASEEAGSVNLIRNLKVVKEGNLVSFAFYKKGKSPMIPIALGAFVFALMSTVYFSYSYYDKAKKINTPSGEKNNSSEDIVLQYGEGSSVNINNLLSIDNPEVNEEDAKVVKTFSIENNSKKEIIYSINWTVSLNTYTTDNLQYIIKQLGPGGSVSEWAPMPKVSTAIGSNIRLAPKKNHSYVIEIALIGDDVTDLEKEFKGFIEVFLAE